MLLFLFFRKKGGYEMSKKIKISIPKTNQKEVEVCGKKVKIDAIISLEKYEKISEDIKNIILYNPEVSDKFAMLRVRFIRDVLELCSNIDISELSGEDFNSTELEGLVYSNVDNAYEIKDYLEKEYDKYIMENCFGIIASKMPTAKELEESMDKISKTINELPTDKLELISKSIVWNQMPALGKLIAPAEHQAIAEA